MAKVVRLAFLARVIVETVLEGKQSATLDAAALVNGDVLPGIWAEQAKLYPSTLRWPQVGYSRSTQSAVRPSLDRGVPLMAQDAIDSH